MRFAPQLFANPQSAVAIIWQNDSTALITTQVTLEFSQHSDRDRAIPSIGGSGSEYGRECGRSCEPAGSALSQRDGADLAALSGFFSRNIVYRGGRIFLQDLCRKGARRGRPGSLCAR